MNKPKKLKVGDEVICTREGILGYTVGKSYKISSIFIREVSIETDYRTTRGFYSEVFENECFTCLWDYFGTLKDIRNKKLKKLKLFAEKINEGR